MDFGLTEEQRMIVETTRAFVENELYPHEAEVERTGELQARAARGDQGQGDRGRALCRQHAGRGRRRRPRYGDLAALREGTWQGQLRAALELRRAAVEHPDGLRRRAARALPSALHPRREIRLPGHDRAGRGFRPARHEDRGRAGRRRLRHQRHQALHQPCRCGGLRHPVRGLRRRGDAARQEEAHHRLPRRQGHARFHRARRLSQRVAPRLQQCDPRIRRLPGAGEPGPGRGPQGLRGGQ